MLDLSRKNKTVEQLNKAIAAKRDRVVTSLYLSHNALTELPLTAMCDLGSLTALFVPSNALRELPEQLSRLQSLAWLDAANNEIAQIPVGLCRMASLRQLDLTENALTSIPPAIVQLTNLHMLSLTGNNGLPPAIAQVSHRLENCQEFVKGVASYYQRIAACRDAMYETMLCIEAHRKWAGAAWNAIPVEVLQFHILPFVWESRHEEIWDFGEDGDDESEYEELNLSHDAKWGST